MGIIQDITWAGLLYSNTLRKVSLEEGKQTSGSQWCNHLFADERWFNYSRNSYLYWSVMKIKNFYYILRMPTNRTLFKWGPAEYNPHDGSIKSCSLREVILAASSTFPETEELPQNRREWVMKVIWRGKYKFEIQ